MSKQAEYWAQFVNRLRTDDDYFKDYSQRFWSRCEPQPNGCWVWQGYIGKNGYGYISAFKSSGPFPTQRVAFALSHRQFDWNGEHICHHCDNRPCTRPDHLFAGTSKDNMQDCIKKGRFKFLENPQGANSSGAKLSDEDVAFIIENFRPRTYVGQWTRSSLAAKFNVSPATIYRIAMGITWAHKGGTRNKGNSFLTEAQQEIILKQHTPNVRRGPGTRHEIAKRLGVPEHAVSNFLTRHKLKAR